MIRPAAAAIGALLFIGCEDPFFMLYDGGPAVGVDGGSPIDGGSGCAAFAFHQVPYARDAGASAIVPYTSDQALFSIQGANDFLLVGSKLTLDPAPIPDSDLVPLSAFRRDADLWFGGQDGSLRRYRIGDPRIDLVATASSGGGLRFLSGASSGPFEIFALSEGGILYRFDGVALHRLWAATSTVILGRAYGGVAWVGADEAYAVPINARCNQRTYCVVHYRSGHVDEEGYPSNGGFDEFDYASTVAFIPELGPIVGTQLGWTLMRGPSGWSALTYLAMYTDLVDLRAILPYRGGFMAFSERHALQWTASGESCLSANLFHQDVTERKITKVNSAVAVNGAVVVAAGAYADGPGYVVVLEEVR